MLFPKFHVLTQQRALTEPRLLASKNDSEFRTFGLFGFLTLTFWFWNIMSNPRNIVGPQIRRLRDQQGLTQPVLAARCRRWGWDLSRETLAKIRNAVAVGVRLRSALFGEGFAGCARRSLALPKKKFPAFSGGFLRTSPCAPPVGSGLIEA